MHLPQSATLTTEQVRARLSLEKTPAWVSPSNCNLAYKPEKQGAVTNLLVDRQVNADNRQTYLHYVVRLENMQAVQQGAQWKLPFDPRTQKVFLHSIKVRRAELEFDQTHLERFHFLQREQGLEGLVLDGWFTALLVLEDIRPGDILDFSYTIENFPLLLSQYCSEIFVIQGEFAVGRFQFSVSANASRQLAWRSSSADLSPTEVLANSERRWLWSGENLPIVVPEEGTPAWHLAVPWIQVSDCPEWKTIGAEVARAWPKAEDGEIDAVLHEIISKELESLQQIESVLRLVQDQHRYLSLNIELGGQIPNTPAVVARRRFGDCKDLSLLLVHLLMRLGVAARPILVSTRFGKNLASMLPSVGLFDHVIVEFHFGGKSYWVDPTVKHQGGGPLSRALWGVDSGLPVDMACEGLTAAPAQEEVPSPYELRETVLLGTQGNSVVDVCLRVRGVDADHFRQRIESGLESLAKERLEIYTRRFVNAARLGELQYRDQRLTNELVITEAFEIGGFLRGHPNPQLRVFLLPAALPVTVLPVPADAARRSPFALPYPCNITHIIQIESPAVPGGSFPKADVNTNWMEFSRRQRSMQGQWTFTFSLRTLDQAVSPDNIKEHRRIVEKIWKESTFDLVVPAGYNRPNRTQVGRLPVLRDGVRSGPSTEQKPLETMVGFKSNKGAEESVDNLAVPRLSDDERDLKSVPSSSCQKKSRKHYRVNPRELPIGEGRFLGRVVLGVFVIFCLALIIWVIIGTRKGLIR
jgi:hypothetical protein